MYLDPESCMEGDGIRPADAVELLIESLTYCCSLLVHEMSEDCTIETWTVHRGGTSIFVVHICNEARVAVYPDRESWKDDERAMEAGSQIIQLCGGPEDCER